MTSHPSNGRANQAGAHCHTRQHGRGIRPDELLPLRASMND